MKLFFFISKKLWYSEPHIQYTRKEADSVKMQFIVFTRDFFHFFNIFVQSSFKVLVCTYENNCNWLSDFQNGTKWRKQETNNNVHIALWIIFWINHAYLRLYREWSKNEHWKYTVQVKVKKLLSNIKYHILASLLIVSTFRWQGKYISLINGDHRCSYSHVRIWQKKV
jgi:hypothetical protein